MWMDNFQRHDVIRANWPLDYNTMRALRSWPNWRDRAIRPTSLKLSPRIWPQIKKEKFLSDELEACRHTALPPDPMRGYIICSEQCAWNNERRTVWISKHLGLWLWGCLVLLKLKIKIQWKSTLTRPRNSTIGNLGNHTHSQQQQSPCWDEDECISDAAMHKPEKW